MSPTYELTEVGQKAFRLITPQDLIAYHNKSRRLYRLINGSEIQFKSAEHYDTLIGEGLDGLIIDEAGRTLKNPLVWHEALRPALADKQGWAWFIGTPKGKNLFYDLFKLGVDPLERDWASYQFNSFTNPFLPEEEMDSLFKLPEHLYWQEVLAMFLETEALVFRNIEACLHGIKTAPEPGRRYYIGIDLAKYQDYTVIIVLTEAGVMVHMDRFHQLDWRFQKARIRKIAAEWNDAKIHIDSTGVGDPIFEDLQRAGLDIEGINFSHHGTKQFLIEALAIAFEQRQIRIMTDPVLLEELKSFEYELTSGGRFKYQAPAGKHDDCVIALALAWNGLGRKSRLLEVI